MLAHLKEKQEHVETNNAQLKQEVGDNVKQYNSHSLARIVEICWGNSGSMSRRTDSH